jgi:hypothetical protein
MTSGTGGAGPAPPGQEPRRAQAAPAPASASSRLRQDLPRDAYAARAEGLPHPHLGATGVGEAHEQGRGIGAGDREHQKRAHPEEQGERVGTSGDPGGPLHVEGATAAGLGKRGCPARAQEGQIGTGPSEGRSRCEPRDHLEVASLAPLQAGRAAVEP